MNGCPPVGPRNAPAHAVAELAALLAGRRVAVLTGAGCSTESGIPDYRGPETRRRARNPIQHRAFVSDPAARARYWARSVIGWPHIGTARPNPAHLALAQLEASGAILGVITQNVDRLHHRAGSRRVVELHGALAEVRCLDCGVLDARDALQSRLLADNPGWLEHQAPMAPDGDVDLDEPRIASFRVPSCLACAGVLKPNVVFFGEGVPRPVVDAAFAMLDEAEVLLVVGSSLTVFSGYRFPREAARRGMPVALVNLGETRADALAKLRIDAPAGVVLPALVTALGRAVEAV